MKKIMIIVTCVLIGLAVIGAGVLYKFSDEIFGHQAKGIILYGTAQQISEDQKIAKTEGVTYQYQADIKVSTDGELVIAQKDADAMESHEAVTHLKRTETVKAVSEEEYAQEAGEEKVLLIMIFEKSADKKMQMFQYEQIHLVDIQ